MKHRLPYNIQRLVQALPLIVLLVLLAHCIYVVNTTNAALTWQHYLAMLLLAEAVVSYLLIPFSAQYVFLRLLLLGLLGFVAVTPTINRMYISFGRLNSPVFQPLFLLMILLLLAVNIDRLEKYRK